MEISGVLYVYVLSIELFMQAHGQGTNEMLEQGRIQYQLIKDRASHPKYGTCWKQAVGHVDEGCRSLSEHTQSDVALRLADCFLEMSGHDTYGCQNDKKQNLRAICVNSMDDRAFNVYTEFYTHTQEMCWFLQGQVWQETMAEGTRKLGQQLQESAENQERLLQNQKLSLEYGVALEKILKNFLQSSRDHQEILGVLTATVGNLQSWIVGELSWIDTAVFYVSYSLLVIFLTASPRTSSARVLILFVAVINVLIERFLSGFINDGLNDVRTTHATYHAYVWCLRYILVIVTGVILILHIYRYKDQIAENNLLLRKLHAQIELVAENLTTPTLRVDTPRDQTPNDSNFQISNGGSLSFANISGNSTPKSVLNSQKPAKLHSIVELQDNSRYYLRSRGNTPDVV